MTNQCEHGQLARVCELCAKDAEIAALRAEYERACKLVADMHAAAMGATVGPILDVVGDVAAVRSENDALQAEVAQLREYLDTAQRRASALGDEVAGLREDAERYRWLRKDRETGLICMYFGNGSINKTIDMVDAAIDAARKGTT